MLKHPRPPFFYFLINLCILIFGLELRAVSQNIENRFFDIPNSLNRELGDMSKDDEGFIWFITNQGLCRYDGNDVKLVEYEKFQLPNNSIPNHLLCYNEFIICAKASKLFLFNKISGISSTLELNSWISKMYKNKKGEAVFITYSGQAWIFTKQKGLQKGIDFAAIAGFKKPIELLHFSVDDNENAFLFLTNNRFAAFNGKTIKWSPVTYFNKLNDIGFERYIRMSAVSSRYISILLDGGDIHIYNKKTLQPVAKILGKSISAVFCFNDEIQLIPSGDPQKKTLPQPEIFRVIENIFNEQIKISATVIFKKTENKVLLSTNNGLIEFSTLVENEVKEIQQRKWVAFFKNKSVRSIYKVGGELLVGTYSGFYSCEKDTIRLIKDKLLVYCIRPYDKEHLIFGLEGNAGLVKYHIKTKQIIQMPNLWFKDKYFQVRSLYNNHGEWICGGFNNISVLFDSSNTWGLKPIHSSGVELGNIRQISSMGGNLLVACEEGVFKIINNGLQKIYPKSGKMRVSAMTETSDGIWLGTHGDGLVKINNYGVTMQKFGFNEGLQSNFVYSMLQNNKTIIVGTGSGVNIFNLTNELHPIEIKKNSELYGSFTQEFNHSAYFLDTINKQVILGGISGLGFVDIKSKSALNTANNSIRLSYIKTTEANANYQLNIFAGLKDIIKVYSVNSSINLKFTCINDPENEMALFRIKGLSNQWQSIKLSEEVNIYSLPPGAYTIEVKLPYSENPKEWFSKQLIVLPVFYQTILFKCLFVFLLLATGFLIWQSRVRKLKKEHKMRSLIASDLHDDIGSTLNSISVYSSIAENQLGNHLPNTKILLDKMGTASRDMIEKMSDIVWAIHPKNDEFDKVLDRIRFFAAELLSTKNIVFNFKVQDCINELKFEMEVRKNIYLICKEALNNAYKYSQASMITLNFQKINNKLLVEIVDNGIGFESNQLSSQGNGLFNMKARAIEINAVLKIETSAQKGTIILLKIQL